MSAQENAKELPSDLARAGEARHFISRRAAVARRRRNLTELLELFLDGYEISADRTVMVKDLRRRA